jgi:valyl-tRNA synthetase
MLDKTFNPQDVEQRIAAQWEASGAFRAGTRPGAPAFSIVIPPPNVTGRLHIGHALNNTLQDILARFERMRGKDVLWQPGTDHAGIATQLIVERQLAERQMSRLGLGREKFLEEVWKWKAESGGAIVEQQHRLGASADWSRERFTMDEGLSRAVTKVFVELFKQGLIYRDKRLVNWDPRLQTAVSDLEVESLEIKGHLWHIKYPIEDSDQFIIVATTRPETMLGDTAVAVNPEDWRYTALVGRHAVLPLTGRLIPIIADAYSDPEKGTGAVKILSITHAVPHDEKTKTVVLEPFLTEQWYLNVQPLADKAIAAVEKGETKFVPENWANVFFGWVRNIRPWCISRQLWWGHQIPIWYDADGKVYCAETEEEALSQAGGKALTRDEDVLDTWFSSALWPFSTLGWPEDTVEIKRFYPTNVLVTGFDIIFFWVARMMMMGIHFLGDVPFKTVLIHNRVLDEQGAKMSKTKGNVVDPITLIDEFGADALRFTLALAAGQSRDMRIGPTRVETNRNFATKLWNTSRFCEMNGCVTVPGFDPATVTEIVNQWIVAETAQAVADVTLAIEALRFNDAAGAAYHFVYDIFCDWYIEITKPMFQSDKEAAKAETRATTAWARDQILKLLHPFMPFITEELWAATAVTPRDTLLVLAEWPTIAVTNTADTARAEMNWVIELIKGVRSVRAEMNVPAGAKIPLVLTGASEESATRLARHIDVIATLARLTTAEAGLDLPKGSAQFVLGEAVVALPLGDVIDFAKERARLEKDLKKAQDEITRFDAKLSNEQFVSKAPEEVLAEQREKRAEAAALAARLTDAIGRLTQ